LKNKNQGSIDPTQRFSHDYDRDENFRIMIRKNFPGYEGI